MELNNWSLKVIKFCLIAVPDPDLEIRGVGGHGLPRNFFRPFGPQFGLKIRGVGPIPLDSFVTADDKARTM